MFSSLKLSYVPAISLPLCTGHYRSRPELLHHSRSCECLEEIVTRSTLLIEQLGPGQIRPLQPIPSSLLQRKFVWSPPPAALQNAELDQFVNTLISRSFEGISAPVIRIENPDDLTDQCPSNFASLSDCFAAVIFGNVEPDTQILVSSSHLEFDGTLC